jgi:hypothetical protein
MHRLDLPGAPNQRRTVDVGLTALAVRDPLRFDQLAEALGEPGGDLLARPRALLADLRAGAKVPLHPELEAFRAVVTPDLPTLRRLD